MENMENNLNNQQVYVSAPISREMETEHEKKERVEAAKRFGGLSLGCLLYAVVYMICMYRNKEGIAYPFFVGATLYFFYYFTKKYGGIVKKNNRFLVVSIIVLGILTCTTAASGIIVLSKMLILFLLCVLLLRTYHDVTGWSVGNYLSSVFYVVFGTLGDMFYPFGDSVAFLRVRKEMKQDKPVNTELRKKIVAVLIGIVIGIPMFLFAGLMLSSADIYFASMFEKAFDFIFDFDLEISEAVAEAFKIGFRLGLVFLLAYGSVLYINRKKGIEELVHRENTKWDSYIAITFSGLISMMYLVFVWVQIAGLFMGALKLPEGYSYAEYARQGFFQLVFVCFFNMCLVLVCMSCFKKHKVLQGILTVISLCTYVMLVSSVYRMLLYISEYQLTFLRVFVLWAIVVIAVVMAGVMIAIYKEQFPLFMYLLVCVTSLYIGFVAIHPDYLIAKYNIAQIENGENIDLYYLQDNLSLDAAPLVFELYEKEGYVLDLEERYNEEDTWEEKNVRDYYHKVAEEVNNMGVRSFNFSKGIAGFYAEKFAESVE